MKSIALALLMCAVIHPVIFAKAYFQTKQEMIERAEVIAIIEITNVRVSETKAGWTYQQEGDAQVKSVLKGEIPDTFTFYGAENFICAQCPVSTGRFIAFLKRDQTLWTGSNWHFSLRRIADQQVEWYVEGSHRYDMQPASVEHVLADIASCLVAQ